MAAPSPRPQTLPARSTSWRVNWRTRPRRHGQVPIRGQLNHPSEHRGAEALPLVRRRDLELGDVQAVGPRFEPRRFRRDHPRPRRPTRRRSRTVARTRPAATPRSSPRSGRSRPASSCGRARTGRLNPTVWRDAGGTSTGPILNSTSGRGGRGRVPHRPPTGAAATRRHGDTATRQPRHMLSLLTRLVARPSSAGDISNELSCAARKV